MEVYKCRIGKEYPWGNRGHVVFVFALVFFLVLPSFTATTAEPCSRGPNEWLSPADLEWISAHPVITVAPDPTFPPIEYFDEDGKYRGIAAEYLALIARETGLTFKVVHSTSWDEALRKVEQHEVDALPAAAQTEERSKYLLFSDPLLVFPGVIITRQQVDRDLTLADLAEMRVAVVQGYLWQEFISRDHPEITLDLVPDIVTGLRKVSLGMADAMVATLPIAIYYIEQEGIPNLRVAGETGYFTRLSFASRNDWPQLNTIVQKALANIPQSEKDTITKKWIDLGNTHHMSRQTFWIIIAISTALTLAALGLCLMDAHSWTGGRYARRTEALQESENRARALFEELSDALFLETLDGRIIDVNDSACKLLGYTRDELLALRVSDLLPENAPCLWAAAYRGDEICGYSGGDGQ